MEYKVVPCFAFTIYAHHAHAYADANANPSAWCLISNPLFALLIQEWAANSSVGEGRGGCCGAAAQEFQRGKVINPPCTLRRLNTSSQSRSAIAIAIDFDARYCTSAWTSFARVLCVLWNTHTFTNAQLLDESQSRSTCTRVNISFKALAYAHAMQDLKHTTFKAII